MRNKYKILITSIIILFILFSISCEWPFNTKPTEDDIFGLTANHNITRLITSADVYLTWNEITVEKFAMYKIERMRTNDTLWTLIADLLDAFQLNYIDTIWDDDDLIYRIGIVDMEDNVRWATASISIPKTTKILVPDEFETIQTAYNSELIDDGDTIMVNPGTYKEALVILGKDVLIKTIEGFQKTTINGSGAIHTVGISRGVLEGFTIKGGIALHKSGGGILLQGTGVIRNCLVESNYADNNGGGLYILGDGSVYNSIIHNNSSNSGSGIYLKDATGEIINNTIVGNDVVVSGNCRGLIIRNNIIYTGLSFISQSSETDVIIDYSLLQNNIEIGFKNINGYPLFVNNVNFRLSPSSPCIDVGHPDDQYFDTDGSRNDLGAYGGPGGE